MSERSTLEIKVGTFVFIGIVIMTSFVLLIGSFKSWTKGYNIFVNFGFINGIKIGAPVRFAGLDVGQVKSIRVKVDPLDNSTRLDIDVWLKNNIRVPNDSTVWVNTLGLLGEKYIEIMPGKNYASILKNGQTIKGEDPLPMQAVTEVLKRISLQVEETFTKLNSEQGTIGLLLTNDSVYRNLEDFTGDIKRNPWKLLFHTKEVKPPEQEHKPKSQPKTNFRIGG